MLSINDLYERAHPFWTSAAAQGSESHKKEVLALVQDRLKTLADLPVITSYFFEDPTPDWAMVNDTKQFKKYSRQDLVELLKQAKTALQADETFSEESLQATLNLLLEQTGEKPGVLFSIIRLGVSWAPFSPALNETLALIGKDRVLRRIDQAVAMSTSS